MCRVFNFIREKLNRISSSNKNADLKIVYAFYMTKALISGNVDISKNLHRREVKYDHLSYLIGAGYRKFIVT